MPASEHCFAVYAIACAMVLGTSASAQTAPCVAGGMVGSVMYGIESSKSNLPFTGMVKTTFDQKLADGNAIHRSTLTHQARDSAGRTMVEMAEGCVRGEDGKMHERLSVNVNDPVAHTNMNWQVGSDGQTKVVRVFHQQAARLGQLSARTDPTPEEMTRRQKMLQAERLKQRKENKTEDLGTRDLSGVSAQGTRNTRTIPVGEEGNDQPLVVVNETWRSKELGLVVMAIRDDPRSGRTTTEYEELNRGEPDPGLFAPPAGYTVQDQPMGGLIGAILQ
jgi:hypothetical protein